LCTQIQYHVTDAAEHPGRGDLTVPCRKLHPRTGKLLKSQALDHWFTWRSPLWLALTTTLKHFGLWNGSACYVGPYRKPPFIQRLWSCVALSLPLSRTSFYELTCLKLRALHIQGKELVNLLNGVWSPSSFGELLGKHNP